MNEYITWILIATNIYFLFSLRKEKKRLRVLTTFVGGLITFVRRTPSMIKEMVSKEALSKEEYLKDVNGYELLMEDIKDSFFESEPYEELVKFVKSNRNLFGGEKMGNGNGGYGGFSKFFLDLLNRCRKDEFWPKNNQKK